MDKTCRQCAGKVRDKGREELARLVDPDGIFCGIWCAAKYGVRACRILDALERVRIWEKEHEPKPKGA